MGILEDRIAVATRHVDEGRRIVEQQRKRISEGSADAESVALLRIFEQSLEIFEAYLDRLYKEQSEKDRRYS